MKAVCPSEAAVRALNLCGGVNPSNPPLPAMGFAPPALVKASTRPRSGSGNASLAASWGMPRPISKLMLLLGCVNAFPSRGRGTALAVDEVIPPNVDCF